MTAPDRAGFAEMFHAVHADPAVQTVSDGLADVAALFAATVANALGADYPEAEDAPYAARVFLVLAGLRSALDNANALLDAHTPEPPP